MTTGFDRIKHSVTIILESVRKSHPSRHAKDDISINKLVGTIDHMIESNFTEDEIGEILDMIKSTSVELFNQVLSRSKHSVKCRQIHSKYIWRQRLKRARTQ
ncbi:MAG: hypothetical protein Q6363_010455 [Candidatus Njordarchaeota archaeon]